MKTIKTTTTLILIAAAAALYGQQDFEQTAYLYNAEKTMDKSEDSPPVNKTRTAKLQFDNAMTVAAAAVADLEYEAAAELFELAAALAPGSVEAHYGAGMSRYLSGSTAPARLHFISALKLDPDHAESHFGLAQVQIETGAMADVCEHLRFAAAGGVEKARALLDRHCGETQDEARGEYRGF